MRDELPKKPKTVECFIYNIDSKENPGTHWTCCSIKNENCFYFDSFGLGPTKEIEYYLRNIKNKYYNTDVIQSQNEVICGHYCLYVLKSLDSGLKFYDILNLLHKYKKNK